MTVLVVTLLLSIPGQRLGLLGVELLVLAVVVGALLFVLDRRAKNEHSEQRLARVLEVISPNIFAALLVAVSGIVLLFDIEAGLYLLVLPIFAALGGGVVNAWLFLTTIPDTTVPE